jgi:hypothetical protein
MTFKANTTTFATFIPTMHAIWLNLIPWQIAFGVYAFLLSYMIYESFLGIKKNQNFLLGSFLHHTSSMYLLL